MAGEKAVEAPRGRNTFRSLPSQMSNAATTSTTMKSGNPKSRRCISDSQGFVYFARFFLACPRFRFTSRFSKSSFETLNMMRTALSMRSASVLPGISVAGSGFMLGPL